MNDEQIKQARMLRDWYGRLAENGNGWGVEYQHRIIEEGRIGPNMQSDVSKFSINPPKPKLKEINLSVCISSKVDMEFSNVMFDAGQHIDRLVEISQENTNKYACQEDYWKHCRVRQNHRHFLNGGSCPLPEGLRAKLYFRNGGFEIGSNYTTYDWTHNNSVYDIIGFEVLGVADGWKYPWEEDE